MFKTQEFQGCAIRTKPLSYNSCWFYALVSKEFSLAEERIDFLSERNLLLAEQRVRFEADLIEAQANCETVPAEGLFYLHADHLGRPQFATDPSGSVVWDMGEGVTPFGDSVNLAGAFAQRLMFPGQYADVETGGEGDNVTLSHNWHRTYDPTLGRYIQSDPIGLAGGLNRYAYVGGNPVNRFDFTGLRWIYEQSTGRIFYEEEAAAEDCECSGQISGTRNNSNDWQTQIEDTRTIVRNFTPINPGFTGYAGAPGNVNNPFADSVSNTGPIPRGLYSLQEPRNSRRTGRFVIPLDPVEGNEMFGRHSFQIHGDNSRGNQSASNGCIILPRSTRQHIWNTAQSNSDFLLEVR